MDEKSRWNLAARRSEEQAQVEDWLQGRGATVMALLAIGVVLVFLVVVVTSVLG